MRTLIEGGHYFQSVKFGADTIRGRILIEDLRYLRKTNYVQKKELQDFLEKDSKAMKEKMSKEEAERLQKEKEMAVIFYFHLP